MYGRPWYEDDLPNILGINPLEAAVLFGVLYYVYGPGVLYEFSREAGKLFSTYAPVVKDVSVDLFNELRDYLEEDREREQLKKAGADLTKLPRRTSNVIERLQGGFEAFSAISSTGQLADAKMELKNAYSPSETSDTDDFDVSSIRNIDSLDTSTDNGKKRKSKREVLLSRNVDIEKVIEATNIENESNGGNALDSEISESISLVQDRFEAISERVRGGGDDTLYQTSSSSSSSSSSGGLSRFQQQMSGNWNSQVIASTENITFENTEYDTSDDYDDNSSMFKRNLLGGSNDDDFDMTTSFVRRPPDAPSDWMLTDSSFSGDIPSELSAFDDADDMVSVPASSDLFTKTKTVVGDASKQSGEIEKVIAALDKDYLSLRKRMLAALQEYEPAAAASCCDNCQSEGYWSRFFEVI